MSEIRTHPPSVEGRHDLNAHTVGCTYKVYFSKQAAGLAFERLHLAEGEVEAASQGEDVRGRASEVEENTSKAMINPLLLRQDADFEAS